MMVKTVEILQQKGADHKTLLIVSCSIYSFLIWVSETNQRDFFKISLDTLMLKIVEIFQYKERDHEVLGIVSCSIYSFLIWVSETNQTFSSRFDQISGCSNQTCWNISTFFKKFYPAQSFSCSTSVFLRAPKELVFLNKTNYSSCSKWLKYYIKILTFKLSAALLYRSGGVRNYFLYKAPAYLPIENIKPFGQNSWSVRTWEPWLTLLSNITT